MSVREAGLDQQRILPRAGHTQSVSTAAVQRERLDRHGGEAQGYVREELSRSVNWIEYPELGGKLPLLRQRGSPKYRLTG